MRIVGWLLVATLGAAGSTGCRDTAPRAEYGFPVPDGFPVPLVPSSNPMSASKVALGRRLFYDVRLSGNGSQSCGTCHQSRFAFADDKGRAVGSTGEVHPRGAMSLVNVAFATTFTWANPSLDSLETQATVPMFGEFPVELGVTGHEDEILGRIRADPDYVVLFGEAFPGDAEPIRFSNVARAIAAFERTIVGAGSAFDRATNGVDPSAMSESARRGMDLFFGERLECFHCHGGSSLGQPIRGVGLERYEPEFHGNGLYNVGGTGDYPDGNQGLFESTGLPADRGRFKAPTLRNIALTAPYMHDGSVGTLSEVIDHYARGGRRIASGPYAGDGAANPNKSILVAGFAIGASERADLLAFLDSLTDWEVVCREDLQDPFGRIPRHERCQAP